MNHIDLANKKAIVTGAARGIGYAIAERLLQSGASVSIWDVDVDAMAEAALELSKIGPVHVAQVDVTSEASTEAAAASTLEAFGQIDILVNNAGIAGSTAKLWELPVAEWRKVVEIDLIGPYLCCRAIVPHMLKSGYGRIVNIASVAGKEGKAGVIALTKSLGKELAQSNILVNCITPAVIETDILKQVGQKHIDYMLSKIPMNRFGQKHEAAAMAAWLASEDCSFTTAATFDLTGGRATY